jgi:hypothetical protein
VDHVEHAKNSKSEFDSDYLADDAGLYFLASREELAKAKQQA